MARRSRIYRQARENEARAKRQSEAAAQHRRKARNRNVDRSVKSIVHETTCDIFDRKACSCGVA